MIERPFWINRLNEAWQEAPIAWLAGVRRVGKTTLAQSLTKADSQYLNCDLPVVADMVADPELFYRNCTTSTIIFDEIHQLPDPARLLKIGADLFPTLKLLATGSSTLAASKKFRDTLTGRKRVVRLTPVLWDEIIAFSNSSLLKRLYHGGLPQALLSQDKSPSFYREWTESFFARDVQRLFGFRDSNKFGSLLEYVMKQSGGLADINRIASSLAISRPTVENYLRALEATQSIVLLRPFYGGGQKEIIKMPKIYGFDTGFVSFYRGWDPLRPEDYGTLWEHLVLEYLLAYGHLWQIQYWRDTSGRELDFIISRNRNETDAIECKWDPLAFEPAALKIFRSYYPGGNNYLISPLAISGYWKEISGLKIYVCSPDGWRKMAGLLQPVKKPPTGKTSKRKSKN
jgi:predicted AAA+ superfamily ATPase